MLGSLTRQLATQQPEMPAGVQKLFDQHYAKRTRPLVQELSRELCSTARACTSQCFVLVDALDECAVSSDADVLNYLESQMYRMPAFVRKSVATQRELKSKIVDVVQGM